MGLEIDILVPMLGRAQALEGMVASLRAATRTPFRLLFLCSPGDEETSEACRAHGETFVMEWEPDRADFAKKINWAYARSQGEWVFQGASDIVFREGWERHALRLANRASRGVVGTNDLHNPAVKRKLSATHILFARDYIERFGGTYDGSGAVFCELYDHQFVDTEFVETAKLRRQWVFSPFSVVEHFHPYHGNADWDETYYKAVRDAAGDTRIWRQRHQEIRRRLRESNQAKRAYQGRRP